MKTFELMGFNSHKELLSDEKALDIALELPFTMKQDLSPEQVAIATILIDYLRADQALIVPFEAFLAVRNGNPTLLQQEEWDNHKRKSNALVARYQEQLRGVVKEEDIEFYIPSKNFVC